MNNNNSNSNSSNRTIKVTFNGDGTVEFDQEGYTGSSCSGDIKDLLKSLGEEKEVTKKAEFYQPDHVQVQERL